MTAATRQPAATRLELSEEQRQLTLLALALTALLRPGFDLALREIASKLERPGYPGLGMFDGFKNLNRDQVEPRP
jgi:hypothetical protein